MEATRPQLNRQISQQSLLSESSTLAPATKRLGPAPSLAGLRQFAAKLGVKIPGTQCKPVDDLEKQASFVEPKIQYPQATYQQAMNEPIDRMSTNQAISLAVDSRSSAHRLSVRQKLIVATSSVSAGLVTGFPVAFAVAKAVAKSSIVGPTGVYDFNGNQIVITTADLLSSAKFTGGVVGVFVGGCVGAAVLGNYHRQNASKRA